MKRFVTLFIILLMAVLVVAACATPAADSADCKDLPVGQTIKVESAWSRATLADSMSSGSNTDAGMDMTKNSAAYMVIHNCGSEADSLVQAASTVSEMTTLMTTEIKNDTASMSNVEKIDVPAGKKVELKPGGYHIMLMGLTKGLKANDLVEIKLSFEKAGEVSVNAPAKAP